MNKVLKEKKNVYILLFKARTIYFNDISKFALNYAADYILSHTLALCEILAENLMLVVALHRRFG